jgi:hypothetical protein
LSWQQNKAGFRRGALAALLAFTAVSATANVLVVRATGPSASAYPTGRSLPDNARITLRANDSLVILGAAGTRTFRGPGTFSPGTAARAGQAMAADASGRRARIGAVRNAGLVPRSPTIWHVDVTQSGTVCLASTSNVMLWRPDATAPLSLTVVAPGGASQTLSWPAGQATMSWPTSGQVATQGAYTFRQPGVAVPTQITFRALQSEPTNLQAVASALIQNGCQEQLDLLVETAPDLSPPAG